jgi:hypothetical protein
MMPVLRRLIVWAATLLVALLMFPGVVIAGLATLTVVAGKGVVISGVPFLGRIFWLLVSGTLAVATLGGALVQGLSPESAMLRLTALGVLHLIAWRW